MDPSMPFHFSLNIPRTYFVTGASDPPTPAHATHAHNVHFRVSEPIELSDVEVRGSAGAEAKRAPTAAPDELRRRPPTAIAETPVQSFERVEVLENVRRILRSFGIFPGWTVSSVVMADAAVPGSPSNATSAATSIERFGASFVVLCNADLVYDTLVRYGVGTKFGSICAMPVTSAHVARAGVEGEQPTAEEDAAHIGVTDLASRMRAYEQSVGRDVVHRVVQETDKAARLSFDFVSLVVIASVIAAMGLAQDSAVVVVASMLVSPLMGPVMAFTFGTVIRDYHMVREAVRSEAIGLALAVSLGFVAGLCMAPFGKDLAWPTGEMESRGSVSGIYFGIVVAAASGVGVSLSILRNNTSSLVGVAISASLLPPAVNAGMCWAYAAVGPHLFGSAFVNAHRNARLGGISLGLTAVNIAVIFVAAMVVFKVKQVARVTASETSNLFSDDVLEAREYAHVQRTIRRSDEESERWGTIAHLFGLRARRRQSGAAAAHSRDHAASERPSTPRSALRIEARPSAAVPEAKKMTRFDVSSRDLGSELEQAAGDDGSTAEP